MKREPFAGEWSAIADQKHLSLYISGLDDEWVNEHDSFLREILVEEDISKKQAFKNQEDSKKASIKQKIQNLAQTYIPTFYKFYFKVLDYVGSNHTPRK